MRPAAARQDYKPVIAYVGRVDHHKGVHLIHHAIFLEIQEAQRRECEAARAPW